MRIVTKRPFRALFALAQAVFSLFGYGKFQRFKLGAVVRTVAERLVSAMAAGAIEVVAGRQIQYSGFGYGCFVKTKIGSEF